MNLETKPVSRTLDFSLTSVNIVFLLLLFFLTAGTLLQDAESEISAPRTEELPLGRLPRPLLSINQQGDLFLDGQATTLDTLLTIAAERSSQGQGPALGSAASETGVSGQISTGDVLPVLHIMPDQNLQASKFLDVVKTIRTAGVWNITLVTIRDADGGS